MSISKVSANSKRREVMIAGLASASALFAGSSGVAWAQKKPLRGQLVGAWTLISLEVTPKGGTKRPGFGGPSAKGLLILDASGRYAQITAHPERPRFKQSDNLRAAPTAEFGEAAKAFGANFGAWSVNEAEKMLIRKLEVALIPNNEGNETKASVSLAKDELRLVQVSAAGATTESVFRRARPAPAKPR